MYKNMYTELSIVKKNLIYFLKSDPYKNFYT